MLTPKMSRDSRKIQDFLGSFYVERELTIRDIYLTELLMIKYTPGHLIGVLRNKIKPMLTKIEQKHLTVEYWIPYLTNVMRSSTSVRQTYVSPTWKDTELDIAIRGFRYITLEYLLTDYGYDEMISILSIVNTYKYDDIVMACIVGKSNHVFNGKYIGAILEKKYAEKQFESQQMDKLILRTEDSNKLLNNNIHQHTFLEMAQIQYNWNNEMENKRIEKQFNNMISGGDK